ncbi:MAG: hypothetical protein AAGE65_06980 [Planctomycetota bacterium]
MTWAYETHDGACCALMVKSLPGVKVRQVPREACSVHMAPLTPDALHRVRDNWAAMGESEAHR